MAKRPLNPLPGLIPKRPRRPSTGRRRGKVSPATFIARSREVSSEQKAIFHNVLGAGRKGVIRKFFDVNPSDTLALRNGLETLIAQRLRRAQA